MPISEWTYNTLYIIESLPDYRTGRKLADDLASLCVSLDLQSGLFTVRDRPQFQVTMRHIRDECAREVNPIFPILHFEIHGAHDASGLSLSPSENVISWEECGRLWQEINVACANNLTIVLAVCHGYQSIIEAKNALEVCPFFALVGPVGTVTAGQIDDEFPRFYRILIEKGDFDEACQKLSHEYRSFRAEQMFLRGYVDYLLTHSSAKARRRRAEGLVSKIRQEQPDRFTSPAATFKYVREGLKPNAEKFEKAKNRYLMADHHENVNRFKVTYDDLLREIKKRRSIE